MRSDTHACVLSKMGYFDPQSVGKIDIEIRVFEYSGRDVTLLEFSQISKLKGQEIQEIFKNKKWMVSAVKDGKTYHISHKMHEKEISALVAHKKLCGQIQKKATEATKTLKTEKKDAEEPSIVMLSDEEAEEFAKDLTALVVEMLKRQNDEKDISKDIKEINTTTTGSQKLTDKHTFILSNKDTQHIALLFKLYVSEIVLKLAQRYSEQKREERKELEKAELVREMADERRKNQRIKEETDKKQIAQVESAHTVQNEDLLKS